MNAKGKTMSWGYFIIWFILACIGVVVSFFVFFVVMSVLGEGGAIPDFAASLVMTACFGTIIGLAQWLILRKYVQRSAAWIGITFLGFLVCSPILLSLGGGFGPVIVSINSFYMSIALGIILGVVQWLAINKKIKWSTVWVGVSLVSWLLAGWIGIALKSLSLQLGPILYWIGFFFAGIFLSALGMMGLFRIKAEPGP